jgi:mono/diheme cytochrome c family protein
MQRTRTIAPILLSAGAVAGLSACSDGFVEPPPMMLPSNEVVVAAKPPPAMSGGTLVITSDGDTAVAADSDRDRVWIVNLASRQLSAEIALQDGDEPGRVVEGTNGRVYVALRRGGAVATIDLTSKAIVERTAVCGAPRGVAYDKSKDVLHVACAGGELVTLPAAGGQPLRTLRLDRDLRDVIVDGDRLLVSRFRAAELLVVGANGVVEIGPDGKEKRYSPPSLSTVQFDGTQNSFAPAVAWRTVALPGGGAVMAHQRGAEVPVPTEIPGGYGDPGGGDKCATGIVDTTITVFRSGAADQPSASALANQRIPALLPVDLATDPSGENLVMVSAGNHSVFRTTQTEVKHPLEFGFCGGFQRLDVAGAIAVAHSSAEGFVVQTREPASVVLIDKGVTIALPGESVRDTGHEIFHSSPNGFTPLACASCHPEGREDGRTWVFSPIGARRTQNIGGGILSTAPLHWDGDMSGLDEIMDEVFVHRMGGVPQGARRDRVLAKWVDTLPLLPTVEASDLTAVERGKVLYHDATVGCAGCHSGDKLTNNQTVDVGTGRAFQVPPLMGLAARAPYMHDGCAKTLHDRFSACGGGDKHGKTSHLSPAQIDDLVTYLETL